MNTVDYVAVVVGLVLVTLFVFVVGLGVRDAQVQRQCLLAGYANHSVTWNFEGFCIREENEYEITVPLQEILK